MVGFTPSEDDDDDDLDNELAEMQNFLKGVDRDEELGSASTDGPSTELSCSQLRRTLDSLEAELLTQVVPTEEPNVEHESNLSEKLSQSSSSLFPLVRLDRLKVEQSVVIQSPSYTTTPKPSTSTSKTPSTAMLLKDHGRITVHNHKTDRRRTKSASLPAKEKPASSVRKKKSSHDTTKPLISPQTKKKIQLARKEKLRELALAQSLQKVDYHCPKKVQPVKIKITEENRGMIISKSSEIPLDSRTKKTKLDSKGSRSPPRKRAKSIDSGTHSDKVKFKSNGHSELNHQEPAAPLSVEDVTPRLEDPKNEKAVPGPSKEMKGCLKNAGKAKGVPRSVGFADEKNVVRSFLVEEGNQLLKVNNIRRSQKSSEEVLSELILFITSWNAVWLDESKNLSINSLPSTISQLRMIQLPRKFKSQYMYLDLFKPLLLNELWTIMMLRWRKIDPTRFHVAIESMDIDEVKPELCICKCQALMRLSETSCVGRHDIVMLFLNVSGNTVYPVLGIVNTVTTSPVTEENLHSALRNKREIDDKVLITISMVIRYRKLNIDTTDTMILKVVGPFKPQMRAFELICTISTSPLAGFVLRPETIPELPPVPNDDQILLKFPKALDQHQKALLLRLAAACRRPEPLLTAIPGPSGTGKSKLIASLIVHLLTVEKENVPKIVVCFPRFPPLDVFNMELRALRKIFVNRTRRMFSIYLYDGGTLRGRRSSCDGEYEPSCDPVSLEDANVILSTVSDCGEIEIRQSLRACNQRVICILDEAGQCFEPESTVPLLLPISHFILFGDVRQTQTHVFSKLAARHGLHRSLFHRIVDVNKSSCGASPLCGLKVQYRMCPEISQVVNELNVGRSIEMEDPKNLALPKISPLKPFTILLRCSDGPSFLDEYGFLDSVVASLENLANSLKLIVITSNPQTCDVLKTRLKSRPVVKYFMNFQGRESDIVVLVNMKLPGVTVQNLKEADYIFILTRAKYSFIHIIDQEFKKDPMWIRIADIAGKHVQSVPPTVSQPIIQDMLRKK